jgi:hypothetical protein
MSDEQFFISTKSVIDAVDYKRLIERFDLLWESAPSSDRQREMRKLLVLINRYEANRHDASDMHNHSSTGRDIRHSQVFNSA